MDLANNASGNTFIEKIWVKYGLISAGIAIAITIFYYVFDDSLLSDPVYSFLPLLTLIVTAIYAAVVLKKSQDNYLAYSQGVTTSLGSFSLGVVLSTTFNILLYYIIDPQLLDKITKQQLIRISKLADEGKIPKDSYNVMVKRISEQGPEMFLFNLIIGVVIIVVLALVIFLISSAFLKREQNI